MTFLKVTGLGTSLSVSGRLLRDIRTGLLVPSVLYLCVMVGRKGSSGQINGIRNTAYMAFSSLCRNAVWQLRLGEKTKSAISARKYDARDAHKNMCDESQAAVHSVCQLASFAQTLADTPVCSTPSPLVDTSGTARELSSLFEVASSILPALPCVYSAQGNAAAVNESDTPITAVPSPVSMPTGETINKTSFSVPDIVLSSPPESQRPLNVVTFSGGDSFSNCPGHCLAFWQGVLSGGRVHCRAGVSCDHCHDQSHFPSKEWVQHNVVRSKYA